MPQVVIVGPSGQQETLQLDGESFVMGRDPASDIPLEDKKVSRKHARIFLRGDKYFVEDLGSANGVLIAGNPISGARQLLSGTEFDIGPFHLVYYDDDQGATAGDAFTLNGISELVGDQTFALPGGEISVGRVEGNAIVLNDTSVSRNHATLVVSPNSVVIEDLESRNGTFVNGVKVARRQLRHGDRVRFGNIELELSGGEREGFFGRLRNADGTTQIAWGMMVIAVLLIAVTATVVLARRGRGAKGGVLEQAYEQDLVMKLGVAQSEMQRETWDRAILAYQQVIDRDPIHVEARRGLILAEANRDDQQVLAAAQAAFQKGDPAQALRLLANIAPSAHYGGAAAALAQSARAAVAQQALTEAQAACRQQEFRRCHERVVVHLTYVPDSAAGRALVAEAETGLRAKGQPFAPWQP